jgi:hypothetical protein
MHSNHHCVHVRERYKLDASFDECYLSVRPLGSHDWTFDCYMINLAIMLSLLSLVFKIQVGASNDGVHGFESWEIGGLLGRL